MLFVGDGALADPLDVAVVWVRKGESGSRRWVTSCTCWQLQEYYFHRALKPVTHMVKFLLLSLAVVEVPSWCLDDSLLCYDPKRFYGGGTIFLSRRDSIFISLFCWVYLACSCCFRWHRSRSLGFSNFWVRISLVLIMLAIVDNIVILVGGSWATRFFRVSRMLRPIVVVCRTKELRGTIHRLASSVPDFLDPLVALFLCTIAFAWLGIILFAGTPEGLASFSTFSAALYNMWTLFTTANFPNVAILAYNQNPWSFSFFVVFLVATVYLLSNILLAHVYDGYTKRLRIMVDEVMDAQKFCINHAFKLLATSHKGIPKDRWVSFFLRFWDDVDAKHVTYNKDRALKIFDRLDVSDSDHLTMTEFSHVVEMFHRRDLYIPRTPAPSSKFVGYVQHLLINGVPCRGFTLQASQLADFPIFCGLMVALLHTSLFLRSASISGYEATRWEFGRVWYYIFFVFSCLYFTLISMQIFALGFERFWYSRPWLHRFDLINTFPLFLLEIGTMIVNADSASSLYRWVMLLHIARGLRLLRHVRPLRELIVLLTGLAPLFSRMMLSLAMVFYVYAVIGMHVFGGLLTFDNPALKGSAYAASNYWVVNFNDFFSSMLTLFCLMVVNNWFVFADAAIRVTGAYFWCVLYFLSFYVITNICVLNILVAMILSASESFSKGETDRASQEQHGPQHASDEAQVDYFSAVLALLADDVKPLVSAEESDSDDQAGHQFGSYRTMV